MIQSSASASTNTFLSEPVQLTDPQLVRGLLTDIQPRTPGTITAAIGRQKIILPIQIEKRLARHAGRKVEVLLLDGEYSVVRT